MSFRYPHPDNERTFEKFCLKLLRRHWNNPHLKLYGRRGEEQLGVDIIDPSYSSPFRAGQCKHHEPGITLPPTEIQDEVEKALKFDPPLEHYAILTTGRVTTQGQKKVLEINRGHGKDGRFIVEVLSWSDIEDLLDDYPDVAALLTPVTNAHVDELTAVVGGGFGRIEGLLVETTSTALRITLDAEIDEAEGHVKGLDPQRAQIFFERLRQRHWDELTPAQKYRVKCGFSNCFLVQGKDVDAGRLLLEAKSLCPESERARINETVGYELVGERGKAHELAAELLGTYPHSGRLVACLIRTAPVGTPVEELKALAAPAVGGDAEVCTALALRSMVAHRFTEAEAYARTAAEASPDWVGPKFLLGQAMLNAEAVKLGQNFWKGSAPLDRGRLGAAIETLTEAIDLAKRHKSSQCIADSYLCRAMANALGGDGEAADRDFNAAIRQSPDGSSPYYRYGKFLFNNNRIDECIAALQKAVSLSANSDASFLLASVLSDRGQPDDKEAALALYVRLALSDEVNLDRGTSFAPAGPQSLRLAAFHAAVEEFLDAERLDEAESFLDGVPATVASEPGVLTARSLVKLARGDLPGASASADEALRGVTSGTPRHDLRGLASLLGKLERHKDALPLWERITEDGHYGPDVRHLVTCAERVKRFDVVLKTARTAREAGISDTWLLYKEVAVLEALDLDRAVSLLRERLQARPGDKAARIRLSQMGLKWGRPELIDASPEALPTPDEATPGEGALAVEILRQQGDRFAAVRYAYELVRRNYDEPEAHASLIMAFFAPNSRPLVIPEASEAGPGVAVRYAESGERERWAVIEDSPNPRPELDEFPVDHPLSLALAGRRAGDTVVLSKTSGRDRTAIVKDVLSKYVYRVHDVTEGWQLRFPDDPLIQVFRVMATDPTTGQEVPDFTDLNLVADRRYATIQEAEVAYRGRLIPVHLWGHWVGSDPFNAFCAVALKSGLPVRSNRGRQEETDKAFDVLKTSHTLVVDVTALASSYLLSLEGLLKGWRGKVVLSQSTAAELKSTLADLASKTKSFGHFGKTDHGYYFHEVSGESARSEAEQFSVFVGSVLARCETRGCPELAELDPEFRDGLVFAFGQHGLESMLLARAPGHVLWTEDLALSDIASAEFGVRRVWTQVVVRHAAESGIVSPDDSLAASAKLLGLDYEATWFDPSILVKAGELSGWSPERWPLSKALDQFAHAGVRLDQVLFHAAVMIAAMYRETSLVETRQRTIVCILEKLSGRRRGRAAVRFLLSVLPQLFGVDVLAHDEASGIIGAWLAEAGRRPSLDGF